MGKKEPLRFSRMHKNALVIQGRVIQDDYNNFVSNKKNEAKIKKVKTIYIEKNANIQCTLTDCKSVEKIILRRKPESGPRTGWLPTENATLDISRLRTKDQSGDWISIWECKTVKDSKSMEKKIAREKRIKE